MSATMPKTRKSTEPKELERAIYHLTLQNNSMMRRLINSPLIERKRCLRIETILGMFSRFDQMTEAERIEVVKEAEMQREYLKQMRESRPLMC